MHSRSPSASHHRGATRVLASELPEARRLLGWLYIGRALLVGALIARPRVASPAVERVAVALEIAAIVVTAVSLWHTHVRNLRPRETFLYGQLALDALLVTLVVQLTGGAASPYAPLYILLIGAAVLLLSTGGGILIGLLAIALYLGSSVWSAGGALESAVLFQIGLFTIVALVTGYLGGRLRAAGTALGEVQTELAQLRLDTGDILNTMSTGVLTVNGDGTLAYINPAAEEMLGIVSELWVGHRILDQLDHLAPGLGDVIARTARDRIAVRRFETTPIEEDASVLGVSTTLVERPGEPPSIAVTAIFQDITEKKRVEGLQRRAERMEAIAGLSASLAHEIKNPLASIRSAVEQIADGKIDREDDLLLRTLVTRESDRLSRLLTEFIDFARVQVTTPEPVDVAAVVRNVTEVVRTHPDSRGRRVTLTVRGAPEELWVRGAEDLLHRAVLNLVLNAVQWAGEGGEARMALDVVRSDLLSPTLGAHDLVRLTVSDTGPGVPEAMGDRIFDPFFTRRPGGTGLGLALVQRAVEAHRGAIFVDNAPANTGLGATFTLYLPAIPPDVAIAAARTREEEPQPL